MNHSTPSLWRRFAAIAQPYFFPAVPGGGWATILLMVMLLIFVFSLLTFIVAGLTLAGSHWAPQIAARIAPGLHEQILVIFHSGARWILLVH